MNQSKQNKSEFQIRNFVHENKTKKCRIIQNSNWSKETLNIEKLPRISWTNYLTGKEEKNQYLWQKKSKKYILTKIYIPSEVMLSQDCF